MEKRSYQVIRYYEEDQTPVVIHAFQHNDITSNSFLRAWTAPCWPNLQEFRKKNQLSAESAARFIEHKPVPGIDNFCAPLSIKLSDGWDEYILYYFVLEVDPEQEIDLR